MPMLTVEDLVFEVVTSPRRRTIELSVERDGKLIVRTPEGADDDRVMDFIRDKRLWVYRKLAQKEALLRTVHVKEYVTGEGFPYLGRSYRLLLVDQQDSPLRLDTGRFRLKRNEVVNGRSHFIAWYTEHGRAWLRRRIALLAPRVGVKPAGVEVQDLGYRWGSCSRTGNLNFHWATVLLPPGIVEYVIIHELVHLIERNHTPEFWKRVERAMPDYQRRKTWLAENGSGYGNL